MRFFEFKTTLIEATGISWGKIAGEQYDKTRLPNFLDFLDTQKPFTTIDGHKFVPSPGQAEAWKQYAGNPQSKTNPEGSPNPGTINGTVFAPGDDKGQIANLKLSQIAKTNEPFTGGQAKAWDQDDSEAGKEYIKGKTAHLDLHGEEGDAEAEAKAVKSAEELISEKGIPGNDLVNVLINNPLLNSKEAQPHGAWIVDIAKAISSREYPVPITEEVFDKKNKKIRSFIQDYAGEYLGIAGLVHDLGDFPNKDAFLQFLDATDMKQLSYYFPSAQNTPLADSFGYIKAPSGATHMKISSKGGTTGAAPSLANLKITNEIENNEKFAGSGAIQFLKAIQEVAKGSNAQITGTLRAINLMHQLHQKAIQDKELKAILPLSDNEITWFNTAFSQESKFRKENVGQNYIKESPERLQPYVVQRQDKADKKEIPGVGKEPYMIQSNVGDFIMECTRQIIAGINKHGAFPKFEPMAKEILGYNFMQIFTSVSAGKGKAKKGRGMSFRVLWPAKIGGNIELWSNSSQTRMNGRIGFRIH